MNMKHVILGIMLLSMMTSTVLAQPSDYDMYVRLGATLRYLGPVNGLVLTTPMGNFEDYHEVMTFNEIRYYNTPEVVDCPKVNGIPIC
jgi:hypothetical protein